MATTSMHDSYARILNYVVVTPAYNEEHYLPQTIESMARQIARPLVWVLVNDGSTDGTGTIMDSAARQHPWIRALHRCAQPPGRDGLVHASEAVAFLDGLRVALSECGPPYFVVKLDADLAFSSTYFAGLLREFESSPRLGIAGGTIYERNRSGLRIDPTSRCHVRGASKIYSHECYQAIGGVLPVFGWDVLDEIVARDRGFDTRTFSHSKLEHLRRTASRRGRFAGWARHGRMAYYIGMSPWKVACRAVYRMLRPSDHVQGLGLLYGYLSQYMCCAPRLPDRALRRLVRRHEWDTVRARRVSEECNA